MRTWLWQVIKKAHAHLTDKQVDEVLRETAKRERRLVLDGIPVDKARELIREELFPPDLDPWAGDDEYGPMR